MIVGPATEWGKDSPRVEVMIHEAEIGKRLEK